MLDLHEARNSVNWSTKQLHLLHYTPTFQALLGAKLPHLIAFLSIKDVTQFNTSDWVEVMWYTQNTFKGQSSDSVHNPVQRLDLTQTERKYTLQMDFLNWQSLSIDLRLSPFMFHHVATNSPTTSLPDVLWHACSVVWKKLDTTSPSGRLPTFRSVTTSP